MRCFVLIALTAGTACTSPDQPNENRRGVYTTPDAGTRVSVPTDTGERPTPRPDAGSQPAPDAGTPTQDSGNTPTPDSGNAPTPDSGAEPPQGEARDYDNQGPQSFTETSDQYDAASDCSMTYVRFDPEQPQTEGAVVFLHGFARGRSQFLDWGRHLASWGYPAIVTDLCHATFQRVDPVAGGEAVADLVDQLPWSDVVIVGHSAGSMAALVAGAATDSVVAVLGLDPVAPRDADLSEQARALNGKLGALYGDPGQCNSQNSGRAVYNLGAASSLTLPNATHCDFEAPSNGLCTFACGGSGGEPVLRTVRQLSSAYIAWKLGTTEAGAWWTPGQEPYQRLLQSGAIQP